MKTSEGYEIKKYQNFVEVEYRFEKCDGAEPFDYLYFTKDDLFTMLAVLGGYEALGGYKDE